MPPFIITKELYSLQNPVIEMSVQNPESGITCSVRALIDTGAVHSCIRKDIAEKMSFRPIRTSQTTSGYDSLQKPVYRANLIYPNLIHHLEDLTEFDIGKEFEIILGMSVISRSDFAITNTDGKTVFSFCFPSRNTGVDFRKM